MKSYLIEVESRELINIEAEDDDQAIEMALEQANSVYAYFEAHIIKSEDLEED